MRESLNECQVSIGAEDLDVSKLVVRTNQCTAEVVERGEIFPPVYKSWAKEGGMLVRSGIFKHEVLVSSRGDISLLGCVCYKDRKLGLFGGDFNKL